MNYGVIIRCDALARPTKFTEYTGNNMELIYTYDAAGRIATMTDYYSNTYSYTWTDRSELASITRGNYVWEFAYNALGQRTQYTHPNGMRTEYDYDNWNRLEGIYHINASTEAVLDSFEYTLNDGNEITRIDNADGSNWRYNYDSRGRLVDAVRFSNGDTLADWYDYTYDDADNMTQYWRFNYVAQTTDIWDYVYNEANQQTSMTLNSGTAETRTYDDWGRLTARAQGAYSAAYTYRYGDRLRQVTSSFPGETATSPVYEYGGDGKLRRRGSEQIRYGLGFNPVGERTNIIMGKSFVYEPHKAVSGRLAYIGLGFDGNKHYYCHDHLGSVRRTRSSAKGNLGVWDYEPYGKVHSGTSTPLIFALHPYESGMGFYTAPYRNYSPAMARWTTTDPLGMVDGPNVYTYVGSNPVMALDSLGQFCIPCALVGAAVGGGLAALEQISAGCDGTSIGIAALGGAVSGLLSSAFPGIGGIIGGAIGALAEDAIRGVDISVDGNLGLSLARGAVSSGFGWAVSSWGMNSSFRDTAEMLNDLTDARTLFSVDNFNSTIWGGVGSMVTGEALMVGGQIPRLANPSKNPCVSGTPSM